MKRLIIILVLFMFIPFVVSEDFDIEDLYGNNPDWATIPDDFKWEMFSPQQVQNWNNFPFDNVEGWNKNVNAYFIINKMLDEGKAEDIKWEKLDNNHIINFFQDQGYNNFEINEKGNNFKIERNRRELIVTNGNLNFDINDFNKETEFEIKGNDVIIDGIRLNSETEGTQISIESSRRRGEFFKIGDKTFTKNEEITGATLNEKGNVVLEFSGFIDKKEKIEFEGVNDINFEIKDDNDEEPITDKTIDFDLEAISSGSVATFILDDQEINLIDFSKNQITSLSLNQKDNKLTYSDGEDSYEIKGISYAKGLEIGIGPFGSNIINIEEVKRGNVEFSGHRLKSGSENIETYYYSDENSIKGNFEKGSHINFSSGFIIEENRRDSKIEFNERKNILEIKNEGNNPRHGVTIKDLSLNRDIDLNNEGRMGYHYHDEKNNDLKHLWVYNGKFNSKEIIESYETEIERGLSVDGGFKINFDEDKSITSVEPTPKSKLTFNHNDEEFDMLTSETVHLRYEIRDGEAQRISDKDFIIGTLEDEELLYFRTNTGSADIFTGRSRVVIDEGEIKEHITRRSRRVEKDKINEDIIIDVGSEEDRKVALIEPGRNRIRLVEDLSEIEGRDYFKDDEFIGRELYSFTVNTEPEVKDEAEQKDIIITDDDDGENQIVTPEPVTLKDRGELQNFLKKASKTNEEINTLDLIQKKINEIHENTRGGITNANWLGEEIVIKIEGYEDLTFDNLNNLVHTRDRIRDGIKIIELTRTETTDPMYSNINLGGLRQEIQDKIMEVYREEGNYRTDEENIERIDWTGERNNLKFHVNNDIILQFQTFDEMVRFRNSLQEQIKSGYFRYDMLGIDDEKIKGTTGMTEQEFKQEKEKLLTEAEKNFKDKTMEFDNLEDKIKEEMIELTISFANIDEVNDEETAKEYLTNELVSSTIVKVISESGPDNIDRIRSLLYRLFGDSSED